MKRRRLASNRTRLRLTFVLFTSELGYESRYLGARSRVAVGNDLAVKLLAVLAALGPPGSKIRLVGFQYASTLGVGLASRALVREGVLAGGPKVDLQVAGYGL